MAGGDGEGVQARQDEAVERIRRELRELRQRGQKITERDLLRLSALTGVDYATVQRIEQELS